MINNDRIVPVTRIDLISLYGLILGLTSETAPTKLSDDIPGDFTVSEAGVYLADQPVKTLDFTAESGTVYFVAAFDFEGIKINGEAATIETDVETNVATLYSAVLADGAVTVTKIGF